LFFQALKAKGNPHNNKAVCDTHPKKSTTANPPAFNITFKMRKNQCDIIKS
jgi:hypothetical protein